MGLFLELKSALGGNCEQAAMSTRFTRASDFAHTTHSVLIKFFLIHRPVVAGIHGGPQGAYSIALSGGYEDDVDLGYALSVVPTPL